MIALGLAFFIAVAIGFFVGMWINYRRFISDKKK
jgi:ABC-type nitrate/sulfonate/bicarbonate transport system permease component